MTRPTLNMKTGIAGLLAALQLALAPSVHAHLTQPAALGTSLLPCPADDSDSEPQQSNFFDLFREIPALAEFLPDEFHCRHILLRGHFRAADGDGYVGVLYSGLAASYSGRSDPTPNNVTILAFPNEFQSYELNGATVTLSGYAHPVCRSHPAYAPTSQISEPTGPARLQCGDDETLDWGLERPVVVSIDTPPGQFLTGERHRSAVGQLRRVELDASAQREIEDIWSEMISYLPTADLDESAVWMRFLKSSELSPFHSPDFADPADNTILLQPLMLGAEPDQTITCVCTSGDCTDAWPIFEIDTRFAFRDFVCMNLFGFPIGALD